MLETEVKALAAEGIVANTVGVVVGAEGEAVGNGGIDAGVFCGATPLADKLGFVERRCVSGAALAALMVAVRIRIGVSFFIMVLVQIRLVW